ncbi:DNA/RNA nuclease SfsA [Aliikangiella sp. IMCC44632]
MKFTTPLETCRLVKRYKRFLADVVHTKLGELTVHCPNTGSMKNCWEPNWNAWILDSGNPKRKYLYTWVVSESPQGEIIGINTHLANEVVFEELQAGKIPELSGFNELQREVKYGSENSRVDFLTLSPQNRICYIEVKSVTLHLGDGVGAFPDAVSVRGQKHLRELMDCVKAGHRAVLLFVVQHSAIEKVVPAKQIDPLYAELLQQAIELGVEVLVYKAHISTTQIVLEHKIPFHLA